MHRTLHPFMAAELPAFDLAQALPTSLVPLMAGTSDPDAEIFFWRTRAGTEVDFVVYGEPGLQAFEVKNAARVHHTDLRPLRAFREDYPEADAALLYRGRERLRTDGIRCLPVDDFLRRMAPDQDLLAWL